jgi:hypothetical protein
MTAIFPASTKGGGTCFAIPDVCKTPAVPSPVPVPYPNFGMLNQATKESTKVKFAGKPALTIKFEIASSQGDEAGTVGGVVSGRNMDKVTFKKRSEKVKVEGQPYVHLTSITTHNGTNANNPVGLVIAPSQVKVIIFP